MRELFQIRQTVTSALTEAGLPAVTAFHPKAMKRYSGAVAAVDVGSAEGNAVGFCNYLGEIFDQEAGVTREVYGKQLEAVITVEIRGPTAADCEDGCETAAEVLLAGLPAGIRPGELAWGAVSWERETGVFLRQGRLQCRALFTAAAADDRTAFLDFTLKGVVMT